MRLALVAVLIASPVGAAGKPPKVLYDQWLKATVECRGNAETEAETNAACDRRNVIDRKMAMAGWCFGRPGDDGAHMDWHRCGR